MSEKKDESLLAGGFVRDRGEGRGVRVAGPKPTDLATPDPRTAQDASLVLSVGNVFPNTKSPLKGRKTKLACLGIPTQILDAGDTEYARCVRLANAYKKARTKEFYAAHGFVSSGVSALLASASLALSASRYLYAVGSSSEDGVPAQTLKLASSLSDSARQNELSAWELCAREAIVRKRNIDKNSSMPWLADPGTMLEPEVKRGRGRPRKVLVASEASGLSKASGHSKASGLVQEGS